MIRLQSVCRYYERAADTVHALDNVDLEIEEGRFIAIMGPSGSGKSTLLNLIAGLDQASSGVVEVAGQSLAELDEDDLSLWRAAHIGFIFQFYNLLPVLTAAENVELPLLLTRLDKRARRRQVSLVLEAVHLPHRASHYPGELSGGEQQRVAIARAIVSDPDLIVADEPTGDLDARSAEAILSLLRELNREFGKTIVMVSHDPRSVRWVDEVVHIDKGILLAGDAARSATESLVKDGPSSIHKDLSNRGDG
jgi:putative ABC transport system ATP-binding protein